MFCIFDFSLFKKLDRWDVLMVSLYYLEVYFRKVWGYRGGRVIGYVFYGDFFMLVMYWSGRERGIL